jgi:hypothetical protein
LYNHEIAAYPESTNGKEDSMKKFWMLGSILVLTVALAAGLGWAMIAEEVGGEAETTVEAVSQQAALLPLPSISHAYLSFSGNCNISCSNGSVFNVQSFSTGHCCEECANLCSSNCISEGAGVSVLCGAE